MRGQGHAAFPMPDYPGMADLFIVPAGTDTDGYVELGSRGATGTVFRKHILTLGPLHYGDKTYNLDDQFYSRLEKNFNDGVSMVQVPLADKDNKHSEDPLRNSGEVIGLEREGNKVYSVLDIRDPDVAKGLRRGTLMGASAMMSMNYKDTRTDKFVGPALLHHCITNRPHVLDLEPYREVIAATADSADMDFDNPIVLASEEPVPELTEDELLTQLKDRFGVDVAALTAAASAKTDVSAIVEALRQSNVSLSAGGDQLTQSDVVGAIVELNAKNVKLGEDVAMLTRKDAERTVQGFISDGRLLPKAKADAVELVLSRGPEALDAWLAPEDAPYIKMNAQSGIEGDGDGVQKHDFDIDKEIERLGAVSNGLGGSPQARK